jgi:hypothetical protein
MKKLLIFGLFISSYSYGQMDSTSLTELHPTLNRNSEHLSLKRSTLLEINKYKLEQPKFRNYLPSGVAIFIAGAMDGFRDYSLFHAHGKGEWWDGAISHNNKYRNGDRFQGPAYFGSTNIFAWTTDAPHFFNMLNHQATGIGMALLPSDPNRRIGHLILKSIAYNIVRQAGQSLIYSVVYK